MTRALSHSQPASPTLLLLVVCLILISFITTSSVCSWTIHHHSSQHASRICRPATSPLQRQRRARVDVQTSTISSSSSSSLSSSSSDSTATRISTSSSENGDLSVVGSSLPTSAPPQPQERRVAIVTGASRGIGRGIATELGLDNSTSWIVYCVGRSSRQLVENNNNKNKKWRLPSRRKRSKDDVVSTSSSVLLDDQRPVDPTLDLTVESIAEEISSSESPSVGIAVPCDLKDDDAIESLVERVRQEHGRLDLLVCSAYTTPPQSSSSSSSSEDTEKVKVGLRGNFWDQSMDMWDAVNGLGLRQVYACCRVATPLMIETASADAATQVEETNNSIPTSSSKPPLICLVSSFGGKSHTFNVAYGVGKAGVDRMAVDMSYQLVKYGVATTSLYPGLVKTEANLRMEVDGTWDEASGGLDLQQGETPRFSGRAVVELTKLPKNEMMERSGNVEVVAELATEFGFTDIDGSRPSSIRSLKYLLPNFVFPAIEKESGEQIPDWIRNNVPDILLPWSVFSSGPPPEMDTR
jgi:dehydrogenase/reductase SDR family member 1